MPRLSGTFRVACVTGLLPVRSGPLSSAAWAREPRQAWHDAHRWPRHPDGRGLLRSSKIYALPSEIAAKEKIKEENDVLKKMENDADSSGRTSSSPRAGKRP